MANEMIESGPWAGFEVVHRYTRAQAIADGVLVDVTANARCCGFKLPVAMTATLFADVLAGNFQMYFLQWTGGSVADPDILRRVFHSKQMPPVGFNRGGFSDPRVDRLLDAATTATGEGERRRLYGEAQRLIAEQAPYISLWCKTNVIVARKNLAGIEPLPTADFAFLENVSRSMPKYNGSE